MHRRARVQRETYCFGVFLDRGLDDLLRRLVQARVDHLEARVTQRPRDDLRAAVVAVEAGLRDDHAVRLGHRRESIERPGCALRSHRWRMPGWTAGSRVRPNGGGATATTH